MSGGTGHRAPKEGEGVLGRRGRRRGVRGVPRTEAVRGNVKPK